MIEFIRYMIAPIKTIEELLIWWFVGVAIGVIVMGLIYQALSRF